ncbi:MAG: winged helix-turn-helix domain-containing protein [Candidatus Nanohaloarchaea archaeon]
MELDFDAVRALSSPTRLRILAAVLEEDRTPTELAEELEKSKSTIASHLATLEEAGLVEKDEEEGRRRVMYSSTRQAKAIVEGKERRVKFSVASSAFAAVVGATLLASRLRGRGQTYTAEAGAMAMESARDTATATDPSPLLASDAVVIGAAVVALAAALGAGLYALVLHRLPGDNI